MNPKRQHNNVYKECKEAGQGKEEEEELLLKSSPATDAVLVRFNINLV